jgi:hypothetical protein
VCASASPNLAARDVRQLHRLPLPLTQLLVREAVGILRGDRGEGRPAPAVVGQTGGDVRALRLDDAATDVVFALA